MKTVRTIRYSLVAVMSLVVSLVMPAGVARATSIYDQAYQSVGSLVLGTTWPSGCSTVDLTYNWSEYLTDPSRRFLTDSTSVSQYNAQAASFAAARDHGVWAVSKQVGAWTGNYIESAHIVWSEDPTAVLTWATSPYQMVSLARANSNSSTGYIHDAGIGRRAGWGTAGGAPCDLVWGNPGSISATSIEISNEYGDRRDITTAAPQANLFLVVPAPIVPNTPTGYAGTPIVTVPPSAKYVAMGDSFSSGEGNEPFEAGSAHDGVNECHRSSYSYPRYLQFTLELGPTAFVACSGATTQNVLYGGSAKGAWGESPQVDALSAATELVTITIGGNDVGFPEFAYECLFPVDITHGTCDEFTDIYEETVWKIENELPDKLDSVYGTLLNEAQNADIYVLGYPELAPYKSVEEPFDQDCGGLYDEFPNNWGDARAAYEVTVLLNDAIEAAVEAANTLYSSDRLVFVPVDDGAFVGHDTCSSTSYFHGIEFPNTEYSVHPNANGHIAYMDDLQDAM